MSCSILKWLARPVLQRNVLLHSSNPHGILSRGLALWTNFKWRRKLGSEQNLFSQMLQFISSSWFLCTLERCPGRNNFLKSFPQICKVRKLIKHCVQFKWMEELCKMSVDYFWITYLTFYLSVGIVNDDMTISMILGSKFLWAVRAIPLPYFTWFHFKYFNRGCEYSIFVLCMYVHYECCEAALTI